MSKIYSVEELQLQFITQLEKEVAMIGEISPVNLYEPIEYTLNMGGKRLRPVMLLMACNLFGGYVEEAIPAAMAVEIFHNFTLLHDDIMDQAEIRRNNPTVHRKYNENVAILSGDAMSIMAYEYLLKTQNNAIAEVARRFSKTAMGVCEGQQYDMDFEKRLDVSIPEYLEMIRLKTATLIAGSFELGALLAGATNQDVERIYRFGINLGLAFQLQDDLLDAFADQQKFGKKIGGDIIANKKTFLLLKALELAHVEQKAELEKWIKATSFNAEEKVVAVKAIFSELNIPEITQAKTEEFFHNYV